MQRMLTEGPIAPGLFRFALPILFANVLQSLNASVNSIWVGRFLGEAALTATSNANTVMFLLIGAAFGVAMAATILIGQYIGANDLAQMKRVVGTSATFFAGISVAMAVAGLLLSRRLLIAMSTPPDSLAARGGLHAGDLYRAAFVYLYAFVMAVLRGAGDSKTPFYFMLLSVGIDIALNPVFIFGLGPVPRLGIAGSALATVLAQAVSLVALIRHLYRRNHLLCLHREELRYLRLDWGVIGTLVKKGIPMSAQMLVLSLSGVLMITLVNRFGVDTTAAFGAGMQLWNYIQMPAFAVGMAVSAMTAQNVGAGKWDRVTRIAGIGVLYSVMLTGAVVLAIELLDKRVFGIFLPADSAALASASHMNRIVTGSCDFLRHLGGTLRRGARHGGGDRAAGRAHDLAPHRALPAGAAVPVALPRGRGVVELPALVGALGDARLPLLPLRRLASRAHHYRQSLTLSLAALPLPVHAPHRTAGAESLRLPRSSFPMQMRTLGRSGPQVSALGLGCMGMSEFYGEHEDAESIATLHHALERGCTFLDTADAYGPYTNEELLGRALRGRREQVFLATKFGFVRDPKDPDARGLDGSPKHVRAACEASLKRLNMTHIDLYYLHRVDRQVPIEETVGAMAQLVSEGKVRYLGLSEVAPQTLERANHVHRITALQSEYSLWTRDPEDGVLAACKRLDIALVPYSPLGRGFLTGTIRTPDDFAADDYRRANPRFQGENFQRNLDLVSKVKALAQQKGCTPGQLALAWVLAQWQHIVPIPGTRRSANLDENLGALDVRLNDQDLAAIDAVFPAHAVAGARYSDVMMKLVRG